MAVQDSDSDEDKALNPRKSSAKTVVKGALSENQSHSTTTKETSNQILTNSSEIRRQSKRKKSEAFFPKQNQPLSKKIKRSELKPQQEPEEEVDISIFSRTI